MRWMIFSMMAVAALATISCGSAPRGDPNEAAVRTYGTPRAGPTEAECEPEAVAAYSSKVNIVIERQGDLRKLFQKHVLQGKDTPALTSDALWIATADNMIMAMEVWQLNLHSMDVPTPLRATHEQFLLSSAVLDDAWGAYYIWVKEGLKDSVKLEAINEMLTRSVDHEDEAGQAARTVQNQLRAMDRIRRSHAGETLHTCGHIHSDNQGALPESLGRYLHVMYHGHQAGGGDSRILAMANCPLA